jgi:hypothetical protein
VWQPLHPAPAPSHASAKHMKHVAMQAQHTAAPALHNQCQQPSGCTAPTCVHTPSCCSCCSAHHHASYENAVPDPATCLGTASPCCVSGCAALQQRLSQPAKHPSGGHASVQTRAAHRNTHSHQSRPTSGIVCYPLHSAQRVCGAAASTLRWQSAPGVRKGSITARLLCPPSPGRHQQL